MERLKSSGMAAQRGQPIASQRGSRTRHAPTAAVPQKLAFARARSASRRGPLHALPNRHAVLSTGFHQRGTLAKLPSPVVARDD
jgi:hypothetical protein